MNTPPSAILAYQYKREVEKVSDVVRPSLGPMRDLVAVVGAVVGCKCKLCRGVLAQFTHKVPRVRSWTRSSQRVCASQGSASAAATSQVA